MQRWDIFCRVVDNYGDIGVCWRLARQLSDEYDVAACLWVDDLRSFAKLCPAVSVDQTQQRIDSVEVRHWTDDVPVVDPADVVIEAFACELPPSYVAAMAQRATAPVWINLEYLSAENWVEGCHLLRSPQPSYPLTKTFFFPGFTSQTGGLLLERDLLSTRDSFDAIQELEFWRKIGISPRVEGEVRVSLFCYDNSALTPLLDYWAAGPTPIRVIVTAGAATDQVACWLGKPLVHHHVAAVGLNHSAHTCSKANERSVRRDCFCEDSEAVAQQPQTKTVHGHLVTREGKAPAEPFSPCAPIDFAEEKGLAPQERGQGPDTPRSETHWGTPVQRGSLALEAIPFLPPSDYDRLLWSCDVNFVRGEDSFVRAQWAQRPFVWQIYPQADDAHLVKLEAFLAKYLSEFPKPDAVKNCWRAWNGRGDIAAGWQDFAANLAAIKTHGRVWAGQLDHAADLANNLVRFVRGKP